MHRRGGGVNLTSPGRHHKGRSAASSPRPRSCSSSSRGRALAMHVIRPLACTSSSPLLSNTVNDTRESARMFLVCCAIRLM